MSIALIDATTDRSKVIIPPDHVGAQSCSPAYCVGANALRRMRGVLDARVGADSARVLTKKGWVRYDLHPDTRAAVRAYDATGSLLPVGFRFRILVPRTPIGARKGTKPGSNRRSKKKTSVATRATSYRHITS